MNKEVSIKSNIILSTMYQILKLVVQRGEAEKIGEKVLTKGNTNGIITELSNESTF